METTTTVTSTSASPGKRRPSTPLRRKKSRRYHKTPPKKRTPTPRSSPYRCSKSPRKVPQSPMKLWKNGLGGEMLVNKTALEAMEAERRRCRGDRRLSKLEERLFETLFLREDIPLLPLHWAVDFRGIPLEGERFCWRPGAKPIVYEHKREFLATTALIRIIELTGDVRMYCQLGLRRKAPIRIARTLKSYLSWAAKDGGYNKLKYIPNIIVEIVDNNNDEADKIEFIRTRMRELARSHREQCVVETEQGEDADEMDVDVEIETQIKSETEAFIEQQLNGTRNCSWRTLGSRMMSRLLRLLRRSPIIKPESHGETSMVDSGDEESIIRQVKDRVYVKKEEEEEEEEDLLIIKREQLDDADDDISMADIPMAPARSPPSYARPPPVIFGFFIVAKDVFLVSADASEEEAAMNINCQIILDFYDRSQGLWNALTVAIATCLARDDMMKRMGDFEEEGPVEESDPDA